MTRNFSDLFLRLGGIVLIYRFTFVRLAVIMSAYTICTFTGPEDGSLFFYLVKRMEMKPVI